MTLLRIAVVAILRVAVVVELAHCEMKLKSVHVLTCKPGFINLVCFTLD